MPFVERPGEEQPKQTSIHTPTYRQQQNIKQKQQDPKLFLFPLSPPNTTKIMNGWLPKTAVAPYSRAVKRLDRLQSGRECILHRGYALENVLSPPRAHEPRPRFGNKLLRGWSQNRLPVHLHVGGKELGEPPPGSRHEPRKHDVAARRTATAEGAKIDPVVKYGQDEVTDGVLLGLLRPRPSVARAVRGSVFAHGGREFSPDRGELVFVLLPPGRCPRCPNRELVALGTAGNDG